MSIDPTVLLRLDESIRMDLQAIRDVFFDWLLISAGIVLFGVLLEGPEVIREMRKKAVFVFPNIWSVHRAVTAPESQLEKLFKVLSFLGWFVLFFGLVGEGVFEGLVSKVDGQLQRFDDILLADAIRKASAAVERAEMVRQQNLTLQLELLRLRKASEARRLTGAQKETLRKMLGAHPTHPTPIVVCWNSLDKESSDFGEDFVLALTETRWMPLRRLWTNSRYGVSLGFVNAGGRHSTETGLLRAAFKAIDVPLNVMPLVEGDKSMNPPVESHVLYLIIGPRPPIPDK